MENQHREIAGYRELNEHEINLMNKIKADAEMISRLIDLVSRQPGVDPRWVSIAKTNLQQGFMALVRAVAKPTTF